MSVTTVAIALILAGAGFAQPEPEPTPIVGGEPTGPEEWDSVVFVDVRSGDCSGTLVSPRLVLTAAHCLDEIVDASDVHVRYGVNANDAEVVPVERFGVHPSYCGYCGDDRYDFAYIVLAEDIIPVGGFITPLANRTESDYLLRFGSMVTLVGYGRTDERSSARPDGLRRKVTTPITGFSPEGSEFSAGGSGEDSCDGDSGGPAFARLPDGTWRLVGVTSRGGACGLGGYYGVPYFSMCWVRDETGVDFVPIARDSFDCSELVPEDDGACSVAPRTSPTWLLVLLAFARRRRGAT